MLKRGEGDEDGRNARRQVRRIQVRQGRVGVKAEEINEELQSRGKEGWRGRKEERKGGKVEEKEESFNGEEMVYIIKKEGGEERGRRTAQNKD
ncbi:hypothetical protein Pmani_029507 [Petrolisthes manimaculis]|uniref:Uncharacterized protein n=1 Tax=Petrolisthes manimaculis TaxID=1843537 RepID=A0AAE1NZ91_9EUCA|nr:hypothetical protein Pmani_029507 [Petrolisthes manimaculis]